MCYLRFANYISLLSHRKSYFFRHESFIQIQLPQCVFIVLGRLGYIGNEIKNCSSLTAPRPFLPFKRRCPFRQIHKFLEAHIAGIAVF